MLPRRIYPSHVPPIPMPRPLIGGTLAGLSMTRIGTLQSHPWAQQLKSLRTTAIARFYKTQSPSLRAHEYTQDN